MAETLSSLPKSPDSAIGTMVDNSPDEEVEDLSDMPNVQKISESCLDDVSLNYNEEESTSINKSNSLHSENPLDKLVGKDDNVSTVQESQNHADETVYHYFSEKDNNFDIHSNRDKTLISNFNLDLENQDNVKDSQSETCDKLLLDTEVLKANKTKNDDMGMIDMEQAILLNDLKDELSQELYTTTISTDCPSYSATLQVNDEGEVEETLLNAEHTNNLVENQNRPKSKFSSNTVASLNANSSLSDFLLSCDADENETAGNEEVNKLTSKNFAKLNFSPVVLSCSPSSLRVNPSIPEDLSEYSNCSDENISLIESEVESTEETENEMVLSASMQFSLNKSGNDSQDLDFIEDDVQAHALSTNTIPIEFNHKKQIITEDASEADCISDIEEDPLEVEESTIRTCTTNHISEPLELPETVTKLTNEAGSEVYLVGTAHFSKESQEDVSRTIQMVRPDIIVLELCKARTAVLELDEETILKESKSLDLGKIRVILNQHGKVQGVLYILLLSVSAHITEQLKMAPGGEFREALHEARRTVPGCMIQLGDRPIQVTLSRALASLSVWQKAKLIWHILSSKEPISKEEVEKCKKKDFIEEMLAEMTGQFPGISEVFVKERDVFLTRSLQLAADPSLYQNYTRIRSSANKSPRIVVGVVGIGHVTGIVELWNKVTEDDINAILVIPPPNLSDQIFKLTVKCTFYGLIGFGIYKCIRPTARDSIRTFFVNSGTKLTDYFSKYLSR